MMERIIILDEDCANGFEDTPEMDYFAINRKQKIMEEWMKCGYTQEEAFRLAVQNIFL